MACGSSKKPNVSHAGAQVVKSSDGNAAKGNGKVKTGNDLRTGRK